MKAVQQHAVNFNESDPRLSNAGRMPPETLLHSLISTIHVKNSVTTLGLFITKTNDTYIDGSGYSQASNMCDGTVQFVSVSRGEWRNVLHVHDVRRSSDAQSEIRRGNHFP